MIGIHKTVLLHEITRDLGLKEGDILLDCTLNNAGHAGFIAESLQGKITVIGIDEDANALLRAEERLKASKAKYHLYKGNFRDLDKALEKFEIKKVQGIIFDLGLSSEQLESSGRGFTFLKEEPLLMTFSNDGVGQSITAHDVVNSFEEENLDSILRGFGGELFSKRIAKAIVKARETGEIKTTGELREIIFGAVPSWYRKKKIHPATKSFQAIRMAVNGELDSLSLGLTKGFESLSAEGRMAVISFHSLEDRIVKRFEKLLVSEGKGRSVYKKPLTPTKEELKSNPRSRSAKLRIIEKI